MLTVDLAHLAVEYLKVSTSYDTVGGSGPQFYILRKLEPGVWQALT